MVVPRVEARSIRHFTDGLTFLEKTLLRWDLEYPVSLESLEILIDIFGLGLFSLIITLKSIIPPLSLPATQRLYHSD